MPKRGVVTEVQVDEQGSELVAALTVGDVTVFVESAEDYDTEGGGGGTVEVNGVRMDYTGADLDAGTVTLTAPSTVDGEVSDRVSIINGGEVAYDFALLYSDAETEAASIPIPYEKRAYWQEGPVDPPVPVTVSDDLSEVLDVPGREAFLNPQATVLPLFVGHLAVNQSIPDSTFTNVLSWNVTEQRAEMGYDALFGDVIVPMDGYYCVTNSAVLWESSGTGRRATQPMFTTAAGSVPGGLFNQAADASARQTTPVVSPLKPLIAGDKVRLQVSQTSGGSLPLIGDADGTKSFFCVEYRGPL